MTLLAPSHFHTSEKSYGKIVQLPSNWQGIRIGMYEHGYPALSSGTDELGFCMPVTRVSNDTVGG